MSAQLQARGHDVLRLYIATRGHGEISLEDCRYSLPPSYGLIQGQLLRRKLRRMLADAAPDVIHVHECFTTLSPVLLSQMRQFAPVVGTLHDVRPFCYLMTRRFAPTGELC